MLRWVLILLAGVGLVGAVWAMAAGAAYPAALGWAVWAAIALIALIFERTRYKAILEEPPGEGWSATGEKFIDSRSGREVTVWYEAATGKRAYVGVPRGA
jgi:hypothetical protein